MKIGIDCLSFYVPKSYLPIESLAQARGIEYAKLNKGLGLEKMAIPDLGEDVASMASEAVLKLLAQSGLAPQEVGRVYLGTESALDAAKPTAAYVAEIVEKELTDEYGAKSLKNCDVLDMTFACIGAVDALENAMDWVRGDAKRKAIVIAADMAKYELESTGEYTQGAGAVAMLVCANPRLLAINANIGVAFESVSDFFKPRRIFNKAELLQKAAKLLGTNLKSEDAETLINSADDDFWNGLSSEIELHKDEPVFDGPYSNTCYQNRITEALESFQKNNSVPVLNNWDKLVFHLPYAFQGRRMITESWMNWMLDAGRKDEIDETLAELNLGQADTKTKVKALSKSVLYREFVQQYIAQGEAASSVIGNMYTASIFMSLLSMLSNALDANEEMSGKKIGFFAYGSGSKSKVLEGEVQSKWKNALQGVALFNKLEEREAIAFAEYENWHKKKQKKPFIKEKGVRLNRIGTVGVTMGYRYYD